MNTLQLREAWDIGRRETRNLVLYAAGKTVSVFGTAIYNFAIGLYVLKQTGSAFSFAVTLILGIIPIVVINPFAGVIADRFNKRTLVVSMDLLCGFLLVSVYAGSRLYGLSLALIYATTLLLTVFAVFFGVGVEAGKPNMVSANRLMNINAAGKIIDSVSSIGGPMLGGAVFAFFDIEAFILVNGISFVLSGISMAMIDFKLFAHRSHDSRPEEKVHLIRDVKEGFHYLSGRKDMMSLFMLLVTINFFLGFGLTVPLPYIVNNVLQLGSREFGAIQGAFPAGMILGAVIVGKCIGKIPYSKVLGYISISMSCFMAMIGMPVALQILQELNPYFYAGFYSAVMFCFGLAVAWIDIPLAYYMQKEIPDEYRGRVLSISISLGKTMLPLAMIASGALLNYVPSFMIPIAGGILFLIMSRIAARNINIAIR